MRRATTEELKKLAVKACVKWHF